MKQAALTGTVKWRTNCSHSKKDRDYTRRLL